MNKNITCHSVPGCRAIVDFFSWREPGKVAQNDEIKLDGFTLNKNPSCSSSPSSSSYSAAALKLELGSESWVSAGSAPLQKQSFRCDYDFFLSHFHGDHYSGLSDKWSMPVYCTPTTARLAQRILGVRKDLIIELEYDKVFKMPNSDYKVTAIDANHCPGAAMFIFETAEGKKYLHCGDFRYTPKMKCNPHLRAVAHSLETIFLDTTYGHPKHTFPTQAESISEVVQMSSKFLAQSCSEKESDSDAASSRISPSNKVLIMIAAYNIGKEKIVHQVAAQLKAKIYVDSKKASIIECLDDKWKQNLDSFITTDVAAANIHVCRMSQVGQIWPFFQPNFGAIERYREELHRTSNIKYEKVLAVFPTGWADSSNWNRKKAICKNKSGDIQTFLVPYSEHSNFSELREFVSFLRPGRVIPTVYSDAKQSQTIAKRFNDLINRSNNKKQFMQLFEKLEKRSCNSKSATKAHPFGKDHFESSHFEACNVIDLTVSDQAPLQPFRKKIKTMKSQTRSVDSNTYKEGMKLTIQNRNSQEQSKIWNYFSRVKHQG